MRFPGEFIRGDSFQDAPGRRHFFAEFVEDGFSERKHFRGSLAKIIGMTGFCWVSFGAAESMPPAKRLHRENALRQHGPIINAGVPRLRAPLPARCARSPSRFARDDNPNWSGFMQG